MPIYEYECDNCGKRCSLLILTPRTSGKPSCPNCGSHRLGRLMSRFATARSDESRMEKLADPAALSGIDERDPASVARWARKMGREMGDEAGEGFEEMVDQAMDEEQGKHAGNQGNGKDEELC
jgi:putative FmdB family regulatory protein